MKIVTGQYAEAKIFTEDVEQHALAQIQMICDNPVADGSKIRVMPDVHPGMVGTIGLTMTVGERIVPNLLGIDIGCGVSCVRIKEKRLEPQQMDKVIRERIPSGFAIRDTGHWMADLFELSDLYCARHINGDKSYRSLGTLGSGNHFIEVDKDEEGNLYLMVHSGSRHLGKEVTEYYIDAGAKELKAKGIEVPYPWTWLEGELMEHYIRDIQVVQEYAALNRKIILEEILKGMKWKAVERFSSVHNYIETLELSNSDMGDFSELLQGAGSKVADMYAKSVLNKVHILRKGAISAQQGELVIIPVNMRDGVILGVGKGNKEWNYSAPHGSGRCLKREEVKNRYTVSSFKQEMKGIYCSCIGADTLDEAPFAYRSMEQLLECIEETVRVTDILKPVYNFKAGGKA